METEKFVESEFLEQHLVNMLSEDLTGYHRVMMYRELYKLNTGRCIAEIEREMSYFVPEGTELRYEKMGRFLYNIFVLSHKELDRITNEEQGWYP